MTRSTSTNRRSSGGRKPAGGSPQSPLTVGIGILILVVAFIISQVTGTDLLSIEGEVRPQTVEEPPPTIPAHPEAPPTLAPVQLITPVQVAAAPDGVSLYSLPMGTGASKGFWQVYFTIPTRSRDVSTYIGGIDHVLAQQIDTLSSTLDIAAYEFNSPVLTQAVLRAYERGVRVRMVTDNEDGAADAETTITLLVNAGIPVVTDDRGALMHNKFMILDGITVWTGSWNYTVNDTYRNNNNALALRSQQAVQNYQREFDEMFAEGRFGPRSPALTPNTQFTQDGVPVSIYFAPEDRVLPAVEAAIRGAQESVRFMAFSFTIETLGSALRDRAAAGVNVQGIFETVGSGTRFSMLTPLFCAGLDVRQDGNPFVLHHKVFIIDNATVVTGSFNFSSSATESNDENLIIITDPDLAAQYVAEFDRRWTEAVSPANLTCQ